MNKLNLALLNAVEKGYYIDNEGNLFNKKNEQIIGYIYSKYKYFGIRYGIEKINIKFHRLQAYQKYKDEIFCKNIMVRHLDGNHLNNSINNISLGTAQDNSNDIPRELTKERAKYASSFLKKYNNNEIIEFHKISKSYKETMFKFNISSKGTLFYILKK